MLEQYGHREHSLVSHVWIGDLGSSKNIWQCFLSLKTCLLALAWEGPIQLRLQWELHTKSKYLRLFSPKPQEYLLSSKLNVEQIQTLTNLRTYMLSEAKLNFKGSNTENIWCSVCKLFPESQEHIWNCYLIRKETKTISERCCYNHIHGTLEQQEGFFVLTILYGS